MTELHTCTKCKVELPAAAFSRCSARANGLQTKCKACAAAQHRAWAQRNPGAAAERSKAWYAANTERALELKRESIKANPDGRAAAIRRYNEKNREARAAYSKAYEESNRERLAAVRKARYAADPKKFAERTKTWAAANPDKVLERGARWAQRNPQKILAKSARRRAAQKALPWANQSQILRVYAECRRLARLTGVPHHVDHIYPLCNELVSGLHVPANLRAVPAPVNQAKKNLLPGFLAEELWDPQAEEVFHGQ